MAAATEKHAFTSSDAFSSNPDVPEWGNLLHEKLIALETQMEDMRHTVHGPDSTKPQTRGAEVMEANPLAALGVGVEMVQLVSDGEAQNDPAADHEQDGEVLEDVCVLQETVWDSALLIGKKSRLGVLGSGFVALILLVNVLIQAVLTLVVVQSLTAAEYTDSTIADYRAWRTNVAVSACTTSPTFSLTAISM